MKGANRRNSAETGIVDQKVDGAERISACLDEVFHLLIDCHVRCDGERAASSAGIDFCSQRFQAGESAGCQNDVDSVGGKEASCGVANASGGTGDDGVFTCQGVKMLGRVQKGESESLIEKKL